VDEFEQYVKDISSLTNLCPDMIQDARNVFTSKLSQPARQRLVINAASLKFWLFDIAVLIAIGSGLTSLWDHHKFVKIEPVRVQAPRGVDSFRANEAVPEFASCDECVCPSPPLAQSNASCPPISSQLFKAMDTVDVYDPNLGYPYPVPWRIMEINLNQDGTLRFNLQRHVAGTEIFMVMDNAHAGTITHIKPFSANEKALCEFNMQIHPCVILGKVDKPLHGGGVYRVLFRNNAGNLQDTLRPAWNIWRDYSKNGVPSTFPHPLAKNGEAN
jgi:hypothetical protein